MTQLRNSRSIRRPASPRQAARSRKPIDLHLRHDLFRALADPTRLRLLACMAKCGRACSVTEVAECCSVDFSVVSRHLVMLAQAGVLDSSKRGRIVSYRVRYEPLSRLFRALADAIDDCGPADCSALRDTDCCGGRCT